MFVQGKVKEFNNLLEINANHGLHRIEMVHAGSFDPSCFIAKSTKDTLSIFEELKTITHSVQSQELQSVLNMFFNDTTWIHQFIQAPASMYRHYAHIGGLVEHTLAVVKICSSLSQIHPTLNRDLLITGAILHDIGKINYFSLGTSIEMSNKGALLGPIELGVESLCIKTKDLDISKDIMYKLKHIILSSLGKKSYGSPVTPSIPEAIVIAHAKLLDSKTKGMINAINTLQEANNDAEFDYHKDFGTIYLK